MKAVLTILIFLYTKNIFSTAVEHSCGSRSAIGNVATIGDSRGVQLALTWTTGVLQGEDFISFATYQNQKVIAPGQIKLINLSQVGSNTRDWIDKILSCQFLGARFDVPAKFITNLGGNDLGNYLEEKYKKMTTAEVDRLKESMLERIKIDEQIKTIILKTRNLIAQFRKLSIGKFLKNPVRTLLDIGNLLKNYIVDMVKVLLTSVTGNIHLHFPEYTTGWEWQDKVEVDRITKDMREVILPNLLDQTPDHRTILNIIHPPAPNAFFIGYTAGGIKDPKFFYRSSIKLFNRLRSEYRANLFVQPEKRYGNRIILSDTYYQFWNNILKGGFLPSLTESKATFYIMDGIHFSAPSISEINENKASGNTGLEYWGRALALKMVNYGWFFSNLSRDVFQSQYADSAVQDWAASLDQKASSIGIDKDLIAIMPLIPLAHGASKFFPLEPIVITYPVMGVEVDFTFNNDKAVYHREGTEKTFMVRGDILSIYDGNGGPDGIFGFPLGEEITANLESFRTQNFECGTITKNYLDIIQPNKLNLNENLETCKAKKARDAN